jgi:TolA-binding protein
MDELARALKNEVADLGGVIEKLISRIGELEMEAGRLEGNVEGLQAEVTLWREGTQIERLKQMEAVIEAARDILKPGFAGCHTFRPCLKDHPFMIALAAALADLEGETCKSSTKTAPKQITMVDLEYPEAGL